MAGAILALMVFVLSQLYPLSVLALARGERQVQADQWAESLLDEAQAEPFERLPAGHSRSVGPLRLESATFRAVISAFQPKDTDPAVLKGLRVEVEWEEKDGVKRTLHERWTVKLAHP